MPRKRSVVTPSNALPTTLPTPYQRLPTGCVFVPPYPPWALVGRPLVGGPNACALPRPALS